MSSVSKSSGQKSFPKKKKTRKVAPRGQANFFGYHAVEEAWRNQRRKINALFATEAAWQSFYDKIKDVRLDRPKPNIITRKELDKILPNTVHQGIAIDAEPLPEVFLQDILIRHRDDDNCVVLMLDQVTDPHNVGAILRSACAFGVKAVIQQRRHAPAAEGVLAKTASGAVEHIPLIEETNLADAVKELKNAGYNSFALDERGDDIDKIISRPAGKCVLILGAEGKGIRPKIRESCHRVVKIPTSGKIAALNVSNAAAICLFHLSR